MNFLKKIFSTVILIISFLLFIYTFYMSEVHYGGSKKIYYLTYYFISSILIFFSITSFFFNEKIKEYLIISVLSLLTPLYFFEGYLIFKKLPTEQQFIKEKIYEKQSRKKWDKRNKFKVYKDLKKTNDEITVAVFPFYDLKKNYSIFRLSGKSNSKTILCNENGYFSIFLSDRYGFNNPDIEWDREKVEYLLVGDTFTHGACVNRPNDISSVLRTLSKKSSLNLGQGGNGPLIQYATLREYLKTNVKNVLWIYYEGNNLDHLIREKENDFLVNYLNDLNFSQNLKLKQNQIDDLTINILIEEINKNENIITNMKSIKKETFIYKIFKFIKIDNIRSFIHLKLSRLPKSEFREILKLTKELVKQNNSKLYFVYLPEFYRYKGNYNNKKYKLVKNIVNELNIPFIDIHKEVFEKEQNPFKLFPFELFGHYNVEGYKKVAEAIYKFTKD